MNKEFSPYLSILLPTFNEEDIIENTLKVIAESLGSDLSKKTEVIITDDGQDKLPEKIQNIKDQLEFLAISVLRNNPPLGKGSSLAKGFMKAQGKIVGFLDVDLSTHPKVILKAIEVIELEQKDIFIASRKLNESKVRRKQSLIKDILGALYLRLNQKLFFEKNQYFSDTQCGFKFFKNLEAKLLYSNLYSHDGLTDLEVLIRSQWLGLRVHEEPVEWVDERESKRSLYKIIKNEIPSLLVLFYQYVLRRSFNKKTLTEKINGKNIEQYSPVS